MYIDRSTIYGWIVFVIYLAGLIAFIAKHI